jgi:pimeloyl-ACP methyl ester carboxylesterase
MGRYRRMIRRIAGTFLPFVLVILLAVGGVTAWVVYTVTRPPRAAYLVTPQTFPSGPIAKASDVTWKNHDGTEARGWIIRGNDGAPAVILLHRWGGDRSWLLNMAVKLNESTGFTVLWPDLRGHGVNPPVNWSLLGAVEGDDVNAAIDYLHTLKTATGSPQVGLIGLYGVELGAYAGLDAAKRYPEVRALALDSVPASPDDLLRATLSRDNGLFIGARQALGRLGMRIYAWGKYHNTASCDLARALRNERVLLLAGDANDPWRDSTLTLQPCFTGGTVDLKKDLPLTGAHLAAATGEQEEAYDRPVIEFFDKALR